MKRLLYGVTTAQGAGATSATNAFSVRNSAGTSLLVIGDDGAVRVGTNASATTQTTASINASGSGTNIGLALVPKGTGALTLSIPDGTATGGNARGNSAIDLQSVRSAATQVASGLSSFIGGGERNTSSGTWSSVAGGYGNTASQNYATVAGGLSNMVAIREGFIGGGEANIVHIGRWGAICGGWSNTTSGLHAFIGGGVSNTVSGESSAVLGGRENSASGLISSVIGGRGASANLTGQIARASAVFVTGQTGDAQTSDIRLRRAITGTVQTELFLDGSSTRAILNLPTGATAGRVWNAKIQLIAVCTVQGAGTVTAGEVFGGNYAAIIKRIGTSTSLVGTVQNLHTAQTDTNMATAAVTITADDTNEALKIEFTPPTTAAADTVIRVVATVYLTEVGY